MFTAKKNEAQEIQDDKMQMNELMKRLDQARENVRLQERSIQQSRENMSKGISGGIVPPHMSQRILEKYKKEVSALELRLQALNERQASNNIP